MPSPPSSLSGGSGGLNAYNDRKGVLSQPWHRGVRTIIVPGPSTIGPRRGQSMNRNTSWCVTTGGDASERHTRPQTPLEEVLE